ncbi:hypothetical protein PRIPAC_97163 [Pristionchus pacificus]|uniref:Uncharacterized protein n=1 Tax=Pristionchus pacificus TaxID=54126 RepID=A0A454XXM8_PRIPA|nr:hypothetical protein PRIPAC_97163 [Pristionchus pacificus]|eukprot:PDM84559.1 hypothetical protein PRIPAC_33582 [Pristionchus pacificus]
MRVFQCLLLIFKLNQPNPEVPVFSTKRVGLHVELLVEAHRDLERRVARMKARNQDNKYYWADELDLVSSLLESTRTTIAKARAHENGDESFIQKESILVNLLSSQKDLIERKSEQLQQLEKNARYA